MASASNIRIDPSDPNSVLVDVVPSAVDATFAIELKAGGSIRDTQGQPLAARITSSPTINVGPAPLAMVSCTTDVAAQEVGGVVTYTATFNNPLQTAPALGEYTHTVTRSSVLGNVLTVVCIMPSMPNGLFTLAIVAGSALKDTYGQQMAAAQPLKSISVVQTTLSVTSSQWQGTLAAHGYWETLRVTFSNPVKDFSGWSTAGSSTTTEINKVTPVSGGTVFDVTLTVYSADPSYTLALFLPNLTDGVHTGVHVTAPVVAIT